MINQAELDLRIATHFTATAQRCPPNWQPSTQRAASVPGTLATKFLALTARFAHHGRHTSARATTGTAHS